MPDPAPAKPVVKLPEFLPNEPEIWFLLVTSEFDRLSVTDDDLRFASVLASLPLDTIKLVHTTVAEPPAGAKYESLKSALVAVHGCSESVRIDKLLTATSTPGEIPSRLLARLRLGLDKKTLKDNGKFFKRIYLRLLPVQIRQVLTSMEDGDLDAYAIAADTLLRMGLGAPAPVPTPAAVHAVASPALPPGYKCKIHDRHGYNAYKCAEPDTCVMAKFLAPRPTRGSKPAQGNAQTGR